MFCWELCNFVCFFSEDKLGGFRIDLDVDIFLHLPFVLIFKIMCFGVMCRVPGFGGLFGCVFLRLVM